MSSKISVRTEDPWAINQMWPSSQSNFGQTIVAPQSQFPLLPQSYSDLPHLLGTYILSYVADKYSEHMLARDLKRGRYFLTTYSSVCLNRPYENLLSH